MILSNVVSEMTTPEVHFQRKSRVDSRERINSRESRPALNIQEQDGFKEDYNDIERK